MSKITAYITRFVVLLLCKLSLPAQVIASPAGSKLNIVTEHFPPYSYTHQHVAQGLAVDIIKECQRRLGNNSNIQFVPWSRAYQLGLKQANTLVFSMSRLPSREAHFQWVGPLLEYDLSLFARSDKTITINTIEDLKPYGPIAVVNGAAVAVSLQERGFKHFEFIDKPELNLKRLLSGRIQLWLEDPAHVALWLERLGIAKGRIKAVAHIETAELYMAFSHNTPPELVAQWQSTLDEIKADGSYSKLLYKHRHYFSPPNSKLPTIR